MDKLHDVGVGHVDDSHVGPTTGAALLNYISSCIERTYKRDGATGDTACRANHVARRAQPTEAKACTTTALMNHSSVVDTFEDRVEVVVNR